MAGPDFAELREQGRAIRWMAAAHGDPEFFLEMVRTQSFRTIIAALLDRKVRRKLDAPVVAEDASILQGLFHDRMAITGPRVGVYILTRDTFLDELRSAAGEGGRFDDAYAELVESALRLPALLAERSAGHAPREQSSVGAGFEPFWHDMIGATLHDVAVFWTKLAGSLPDGEGLHPRPLDPRIQLDVDDAWLDRNVPGYPFHELAGDTLEAVLRTWYVVMPMWMPLEAGYVSKQDSDAFHQALGAALADSGVDGLETWLDAIDSQFDIDTLVKAVACYLAGGRANERQLRIVSDLMKRLYEVLHAIVRWRMARAVGDRRTVESIEADPEFPRLAATWDLRG